MRLLPGPRLTAAAACILIALGAAYYLTCEPAPTISIRWREDVPESRRHALERRFLLVETERQGPTSRYDLLDTRRSNLRAILGQREVWDTGGINRTTLTFAPDYPYGSSWMWIAHRTPLLRIPGVVEAIVGVCSLVVIAGMSRRVMRWRRGGLWKHGLTGGTEKQRKMEACEPVDAGPGGPGGPAQGS